MDVPRTTTNTTMIGYITDALHGSLRSKSHPRSTAEADLQNVHQNPDGATPEADPNRPARFIVYICEPTTILPKTINPSTSARLHCYKPEESSALPSAATSQPAVPYYTVVDKLFLLPSPSFQPPLQAFIASITSAIFKRNGITIDGPSIRMNHISSSMVPTVFGTHRFLRELMYPLSNLDERQFSEILRGLNRRNEIGECFVLLPDKQLQQQQQQKQGRDIDYSDVDVERIDE
ncbi:hypothetical protein SCAR479_07384 [Seiridium cardinale]|uniref:Uncharacterized protein n=1 Tax=Seiridium cardinale TaxID=138064 RepID=A0ABR2XQ08_9PEZI